MTLQEYESTRVQLRWKLLPQKKVTIQRNYFHTLCESQPGILKVLKIDDKGRPVKTIYGVLRDDLTCGLDSCTDAVTGAFRA